MLHGESVEMNEKTEDVTYFLLHQIHWESRKRRMGGFFENRKNKKGKETIKHSGSI